MLFMTAYTSKVKRTLIEFLPIKPHVARKSPHNRFDPETHFLADKRFLDTNINTPGIFFSSPFPRPLPLFPQNIIEISRDKKRRPSEKRRESARFYVRTARDE